MEGSRGRRTNMVVVVAILVGLRSINVGGVKGQSNCDAYDNADVCVDTPQCCNSVKRLVTKDVSCFCTAIEGMESTDVSFITKAISDTCGFTVRQNICSNGHKNEAFSVTKWAVGLILMCIVTIIVPLK